MGDYLYSCNDRGLLICYNARTGEQVYQTRVGTKGATFSASPVAADGKLFLASEDGDVYVVKLGTQYELLAVNPMAEICMATPAIADNLKRITDGAFVIDQERLSGLAGQPDKVQTVILEVRDGLVIRLWVLPEELK